MARFRKPVRVHALRGFESPPLRHFPFRMALDYEAIEALIAQALAAFCLISRFRLHADARHAAFVVVVDLEERWFFDAHDAADDAGRKGLTQITHLANVAVEEPA